MINTAISFIQKLSNRELAITIWLLVGIIYALFQCKIREPILQAIKAFFAWKLVISYVLMFSYITFMLLLLNALGLWRLTHFFPNTVLWVVCIAFVMLFEYEKAKEQRFFKNVIKDSIKVLIVLEFLFNLSVFDLWVELLLVPISIILGGILAIAKTDKKYHIVYTLLNYIVAIIGFGLASYVLYMVVIDFKHFATLGNFENFYLPILLTIMFLPFIYFVAVCVSYESLFFRLKFFVKDRDMSLLRYMKKRTLFAFGLNLWRLDKWSKHINTLRFMDENGIDKAIREFKNADHAIGATHSEAEAIEIAKGEMVTKQSNPAFKEFYKDWQPYKDYLQLPDSHHSPAMEKSYKDSYEAEKIVKNLPCSKGGTLDQYFSKKPKLPLKDLGWDEFPGENGIDVVRTFLLNPSESLETLEYKWHVDSTGKVKAINDEAIGITK